MPELSVTDEQLRRLRSVCSDLEAAYVGPYGRVQPEDALEYLLDTYTPPEEGDAAPAEGRGSGAAAADDGSAPAADASGAEDVDDGSDGDEGGDDLTAIEGVGEVTAAALAEAGFDSLSAIEAADPAALTEAEGVGEKQAVDIVAAVAEMDGAGSDVASDGSDSGSGGGSGETGPGAGDPASNSPADTLQQAMSLLDAHDDRWRESSGDEPYEVDLPDGSTEAVRTKDDVKRLLFKHWR